jgi:ribosome modulation factor
MDVAGEIDDLVRPFREGGEAYMEGKSAKHLPYQRLSEKGAQWLRGWHTARYFDLMENRNNVN